jgi:hypothetical protein
MGLRASIQQFIPEQDVTHSVSGRRIAGLVFSAPILRNQPPAVLPPQASRRRRIWDLSEALHCSIIGTCLTTGNLRVLLRKADPSIDPAATDHDLHTLAVGACGQHTDLAKRIQKALDEQHKLTLSRYAKAASIDDLAGFWATSVRTGDIPGAYWALLSHPLTNDALLRRAFGDIHMLSHQIGASNRADLQKMHALELQNAALEEKVARQQEQLRSGMVTRDAKILALTEELSHRIAKEQLNTPRAEALPDLEVLKNLVSDLRKQMDLEIRRRERAERRIDELSSTYKLAMSARKELEQKLYAMTEELEAAESGLASYSNETHSAGLGDFDLTGITVLYVGGRTNQVAHLRLLVERASGEFLHHDGGVEERTELLPGMVSRAHLAVCPIDCVSHAAALMLKRLCRQSDKPFVPLRSTGIASLLHAVKAAAPNGSHSSVAVAH